MNFAIHLDNLHQRLESYDANPALDSQGNWYCPYSGQVTVQDLPLSKQGSLYFPSEMHTAHRDLSIIINGKLCRLWRDSIGPEILELAQAIATQNRQVILQTEQQVRERIPAAKTRVLITEALNWLQIHNPTALEWFLFTELGWKIEAHADAIVQAVLRQDPAWLQQTLFDQTGETLSIEEWHPRPGYADPDHQMLLRAIEIAINHLFRRDPQLVRWFVTHALNLPYEIQERLLTEARIVQLLQEDTGASAEVEPTKARIRARHKKPSHERSLAGRKQEAVAIIKAGKVVEFEFESTGDPEVDAAIRKDLARVKDRITLPANIKDGRRRINITFEEKGFKR